MAIDRLAMLRRFFRDRSSRSEPRGRERPGLDGSPLGSIDMRLARRAFKMPRRQPNPQEIVSRAIYPLAFGFR
jgi:hypothetical protein